MPGLVGMISHTAATLFQLSTSVAWVLLFFSRTYIIVEISKPPTHMTSSIIQFRFQLFFWGIWWEKSYFKNILRFLYPFINHIAITLRELISNIKIDRTLKYIMLNTFASDCPPLTQESIYFDMWTKVKFSAHS